MNFIRGRQACDIFGTTGQPFDERSRSVSIVEKNAYFTEEADLASDVG